MAHSTFLQGDDIQDVRRSLVREKLGVIGGFLVGLSVGVPVVGTNLVEMGAPEWLATAATILVVAAATSIGHRLGVRRG